ncbi:MAG: A/G-specific adenine glycosylase [Terriglobales bacterium]
MASAITFSPQKIRQFRRRLLGWFKKEQRKLPWRGEGDPYRILVSEIMLQQTRVAAVEERYKKFITQFPSAKRLAAAREQTVLAAWSGLGYYRRARALHAAAKQIAGHAAAKQIPGNGGFPRTAETLRALPGVGRYTAAAVASIAFGEPAAVVDGNVKRVLSRLFGMEMADDQYWTTANELLDPKNPGDFNQAMMELGALICLPGKPLCERCPVAAMCAERGAGTRTRQPPRKKAELRYLLAIRHGRVLLRQRPQGSSLMPGMWELPEHADAPAGQKPMIKTKHSITTTDYRVLVFASDGRARQGTWVPLRKTEKMALTGLTGKILRQAGFVRQ